jgi:NAD(P)-dependent dehydrogenase (short-subunit alcohol dehydrogenase family)
MTRKIAIISGAARGIGRVTATTFLDHRWRVLGLDLDAAGLEEVSAGHPGEFLGVPTDVSSREAVEAAVARIDELGGELHAVLNIAGAFPPSRLSDYDVERYRVIFDSSVLGTVNVSAVAAPLLAPAHGVIVNIASTASFAPPVFHMFYAAAKTAVVSLTRSFALELAPSGIRVNALAPGYTRTERVIANGRMDGSESQIPLGRGAEPAEMADILWMMAGEDRMPYMTGETVMVSGGFPMR